MAQSNNRPAIPMASATPIQPSQLPCNQPPAPPVQRFRLPSQRNPPRLPLPRQAPRACPAENESNRRRSRPLRRCRRLAWPSVTPRPPPARCAAGLAVMESPASPTVKFRPTPRDRLTAEPRDLHNSVIRRTSPDYLPMFWSMWRLSMPRFAAQFPLTPIYAKRKENMPKHNLYRLTGKTS